MLTLTTRYYYPFYFRRARDRQFVDELMNLQSIRSYDLPVNIKAEFRPYQLDGVKWLAFLQRYAQYMYQKGRSEKNPKLVHWFYLPLKDQAH